MTNKSHTEKVNKIRRKSEILTKSMNASTFESATTVEELNLEYDPQKRFECYDNYLSKLQKLRNLSTGEMKDEISKTITSLENAKKLLTARYARQLHKLVAQSKSDNSATAANGSKPAQSNPGKSTTAAGGIKRAELQPMGDPAAAIDDGALLEVARELEVALEHLSENPAVAESTAATSSDKNEHADTTEKSTPDASLSASSVASGTTESTQASSPQNGEPASVIPKGNTQALRQRFSQTAQAPPETQAPPARTPTDNNATGNRVDAATMTEAKLASEQGSEQDSEPAWIDSKLYSNRDSKLASEQSSEPDSELDSELASEPDSELAWIDSKLYSDKDTQQVPPLRPQTLLQQFAIPGQLNAAQVQRPRRVSAEEIATHYAASSQMPEHTPSGGDTHYHTHHHYGDYHSDDTTTTHGDSHLYGTDDTATPAGRSTNPTSANQRESDLRQMQQRRLQAEAEAERAQAHAAAAAAAGMHEEGSASFGYNQPDDLSADKPDPDTSKPDDIIKWFEARGYNCTVHSEESGNYTFKHSVNENVVISKNPNGLSLKLDKNNGKPNYKGTKKAVNDILDYMEEKGLELKGINGDPKILAEIHKQLDTHPKVKASVTPQVMEQLEAATQKVNSKQTPPSPAAN